MSKEDEIIPSDKETKQDSEQLYSKDTYQQNTPVGFRAIFGIVIVFVYLAMGVLTLCGFFSWLPEWAKYGLGILFIVYGLWRGYR